jgi:hypothetical protein
MDIKAFLQEQNTLQSQLQALDAMLHRKYWVDRDCFFKAEIDLTAATAKVEIHAYDNSGTRMSLDTLSAEPERMEAFLALSTGFRAWLRGQVADLPTHADLGMSKDRPDLVFTDAELSGDVELVNLCPHPVLLTKGRDLITFDACAPGSAARVDLLDASAPDVAGCPCVQVKYGTVAGLPDMEPGVVYIVSSLVFQACPDRHDIVSPDTRPGRCERDAEGRVSRVCQFRRHWLD